jgi:hypothetical protein
MSEVNQKTKEERIEEVRSKFGEQEAVDASHGMYWREAIAIIMHGPIKNRWPDPPSEKIRMEDGTVLGWMYEDRYWGAIEE